MYRLMGNLQPRMKTGILAAGDNFSDDMARRQFVKKNLFGMFITVYFSLESVHAKH